MRFLTNVKLRKVYCILYPLPISSKWLRFLLNMKLGFPQSTYTIYRLITADLANQTKHVAFASSIFNCSLLDHPFNG